MKFYELLFYQIFLSCDELNALLFAPQEFTARHRKDAYGLI
jgi:hypothetical protein